MNHPEVILVSHGFQKLYEYGFANGLAGAGVAVTLIGSDDTQQDKLQPGVRLVNLRGSQDAGRPVLTKALNLLAYHLRLLWYVALNRHCVVHVIGVYRNPILTGVLTNALLRLLSRRLVVTVHDILPHNQHTAWNRLVFRQIFRSAHALVVHTPKMKLGLSDKLGIGGPHVVVMEHGIDAIPTLDRAEGEALRRHLGWLPQDVVLLLFGQMSYYKGADILVRAFEQLDDRYRLLIVGKVPAAEAAFGAELVAQIERSPRRSHIVRQDEYIDDARIPALMAAADLAVMPYRYIDQSGVLFLAHSHGLPIVAFDVGSLASYLGEDRGSVVHEQSPQALAQAVARHREPTPWSTRESIRRFAANYLWNRTVLGVLPCYQSGAAPTP